VAVLETSEMGVELLDCIAIPTIADGSNRQIDVRRLGLWLESVSPDRAFVENVTPMPSLQGNRSMGATSAFRFGMACGAIRATLVSYSIPVVLVTPSSWKRALGFAKASNKEASRQMALERIPDSARFLKRKGDHNLAEALLIALYGSQDARCGP
jgi:Holliday junction resolvasome RuvABC endonuclease subunit